MFFPRFTALIALIASASASNLRRRETSVIRGCPAQAPRFGDYCEPGVSCDYHYMFIPGARADGTCTGDATCSPLTTISCGRDGRWERPVVASVASCRGGIPSGAYQRCDPSEPKGCPSEQPVYGSRCQAGVTCEYEHLLFPTYQADGTCSGPYSCTPTTTYECDRNGYWSYPISASVIPCAGDEPFSAFKTCSPSRNDICPTRAPQTGESCNRNTNLPDCGYDFIEAPTGTAGGKCEYECKPTYGCSCEENGEWMCYYSDYFFDCDGNIFSPTSCNPN